MFDPSTAEFKHYLFVDEKNKKFSTAHPNLAEGREDQRGDGEAGAETKSKQGYHYWRALNQN